MAKSGLELFYSIRLRYVLHYLGQLLLIAACLNVVTVLAGLMLTEYTFTLYYAGVVVFLAALGLCLMQIEIRGSLQVNEVMVISALAFLCLPIVSAVPLCFAGHDFSDALFETVSSVTTTGLSTIGAIEERAKLFSFARSWMQWYGGLGIVILSLVFVVRPGLSAMRLSKIDIDNDDLAGGTRAYAKRILTVYLAISIAGFILWLVFGGKPFEGLLYILAAVSTGGFAPTDGSLSDVGNPYLVWVVTLTCLAGAVPLILYYYEGRSWRRFVQNMEVRSLFAAGLLTTLGLGLLMGQKGFSGSEVLWHAPLMALSAQTTSGFSSIDPGALGMVSKAVLIGAMATGGSIGSTAGGFKLLRLLILISVILKCVLRVGMPTGSVFSQKIGKRVVGEEDIQNALMIILTFGGVVFFSWLPFLYYGYAPLDALFEVVSATATVGLSSGITGTTLPDPLKYVLCIDMLFGRLEFVAWMVFFYPRTWFGRKRGV